MKTQFMSAFWATTFLSAMTMAAGAPAGAPTTEEKLAAVLNEIQGKDLCQDVTIKSECFEPNSCKELIRQKNEALYRLRHRVHAQIPPVKRSYDETPERPNVTFERDEDFACANAIALLMTVSAGSGPLNASNGIPVFKRPTTDRKPQPVIRYSWSNPGVAF